LIAILGFNLYRPEKFTNKTKTTLFAILYGIGFSTGIISFGAKILNHTNLVSLIFATPNFILFLILIFLFIKCRKTSDTEKTRFLKGLLIRSTIILVIFLIVLPLPYYILNVHFNKSDEVLHNRGLGKLYYLKSIEHSQKEEYNEALSYANKSLDSYKIAWGQDSTRYWGVYEAFFHSYYGLIQTNFQAGNYQNVLEYSKLIQTPMAIWYGDSCKQEAMVMTMVAGVYQEEEKYNIADSLYIEALNIYKHYFKSKNLYYSSTLQLLANSYREQYYYKDAIDLYESVIYLLQKDTSNYTSTKQPEEAKCILENSIASANSEMAWAYSLNQNYDTAQVLFEKALAIESFKIHQDFPTTLTRYANNTLYQGDYKEAKERMTNAVQISLEAYGAEHYDYLNALDGLNSVNTTLAEYDEAEKGCIKAISILNKITDSKDDYYASLIYAFGQVKYNQASYDSALTLYNQALRYTSEKTIQYADILVSLSRLNDDLTKYDVAYSQAKHASRIANDYFDNEDSPFMVEYFRNEAYVNYLLSKYTNADRLYKKCYSIDTTNNNEGEVSFASTLNGLGLIKSAKNDFIDADTLFNNSLKIYKNKIGVNHPNYATVLYNRAYLRLKQKKLNEAEKLFNESLGIIIETISDKHDKVADNYTGLGEIKLKQKDYETALDYFEKAYSIYNDKFDDEHAKVILTLRYIGSCKKEIEEKRLPTKNIRNAG
jgi:TolA-binding protein